MKSLLTLLFVNVLSYCYAQNVDIPKKEFTVFIAEETTTLARGDRKNVDIQILKSKSYQKSKVKMGLSSSLPPGITITFDSEVEKSDLIHATISALPDTAPGVYSIIVNATINYKTKGSILKITVT
jgi:hypothetical protein